MNKFQFSLLAVAMLIASSDFAAMKKPYKGTVALPCDTALLLNDGFYIGAAAGYDSYHTGDSIQVTNPVGTQVTWDPILNASGAVGGLFVGYGQYFRYFYNSYLGFELFGSLSSAETSYDLNATTPTINAVFNTKMVNHSNLGFSFLPGIQMNTSSLLYLRVGYNWTIMNIDEYFVSNSVLVDDDNKSKTTVGFNYGLGIETALYKSFSLRAEYSHTDFNAFDTDFGTRIGPADNQFMLGLIYHVKPMTTLTNLPCSEILKDGFYVGVAAGYDTYSFVNNVVANDPFEPNIGVALDPRLSGDGAVGGGFIGYGKYFNRFFNTYLGFEIFGNGTEAKAHYAVNFNEDPNESTDRVKLKIDVASNYGASFLPGIRFTNATLFYFKLGYNFTRIQVTETYNDDDIGEISNENAHTSNGFSYGPGMELATSNNNLSVRMEYTHTSYDSFKSETYNEITPSYNQFMLGVIYHFI